MAWNFLDKVPCREKRMTPYEMMLSETQEKNVDDNKTRQKKNLLIRFSKSGG